MNVYKSVDGLVGNTPLIELINIEKKLGLYGKLYAKLEYLNPAGSSKDRIAVQMLNDGEKSGKINMDTTIIEATSGNTGIGLSSICAVRGYHIIIVMPDNMSAERIKTMKAYGAEVILTDGKLGMKGAIEKKNELLEKYPNHFVPDQFSNPSGPLAHYLTTGPEIYNDLDGKIDYFVAGVGCGSTISGTGKYLKENDVNIKVIGVEPETSAVINGKKAGSHGIQGIGAGFITDIYDSSVVDRVITSSDEDAYEFTRLLAKTEGILCGISSGAALYAGVEIAKKKESEGKNVVVLLPDSGDRYLSTDLFI